MTAAEIAPYAALMASIIGPAVTWGTMRQRVNDLVDQLTKLATKESVEGLDNRVGDLEDEMREARASLATIPVMDERLKGFEKLMTSQMDELKHGVRGLKMALDGLAPRGRRSPQT